MADTRSSALVLFGITGDLAKKKLFPALYHLEERERLPETVIGVASIAVSSIGGATGSMSDSGYSAPQAILLRESTSARS